MSHDGSPQSVLARSLQSLYFAALPDPHTASAEWHRPRRPQVLLASGGASGHGWYRSIGTAFVAVSHCRRQKDANRNTVPPADKDFRSIPSSPPLHGLFMMRQERLTSNAS